MLGNLDDEVMAVVLCGGLCVGKAREGKAEE